MGNSVADWRGDSPDSRFRDRQSVFGVSPEISTYWTTGGQPDLVTKYSPGSASRIIDHNNPLFHTFMRQRGSHQALRNIDMGFPLAIERTSLSMPSVIRTEVNVTKAVKAHFQGVFAPSVVYKNDMSQIANGRFPAIPSSLGADQAYLWSLGSTAIAKSLPDVPEFSLFRFVGELRAGLPKIPLKVLATERKLRNAGGEYLNYQFGIMPTISDLQNLFEALSDPRLRAAVKHQLNEEHRVRKTIEKGSTFTTRPLSGTEMSVMPSSFSSGIKGHVETKQDFRIWSSCSFAYYQVSELDRLLADLDQTLGGLGAVPRAIDVWNLIPWSWLVDWFTNLNHVITNLSYLGRDGLYLQRGYIMATYRDVVTTTQSRTFMSTPISTTGVRTFERKYRVRASPFGFGLTWKDFDPFQLSILAALGVSRLKR